MGKQLPQHLIDAELEEEFVCSMVRAAQRVEGDTADWASEYFLQGLEIQPADLVCYPARDIYAAAVEIVERGGVPAWSLVRSAMLERGDRNTLLKVHHLIGMSTGLISAIPTFVERLKDLAAQRTAYAQ